jgi:hypothetical protein
MRSRLVWTVASVLCVGLAAAEPASAQQTLNFNLGLFNIRGEDARVEGDVLVENRDTFVFDFDDFNTASIGAEWLFPIGEFLEAGAGIQFSNRTVPTLYDEFVRPDGSEIEQEIKLRIVPISGTLRVLPLGKSNAFQPYVGGGIALYNWRYTETGDFINFSVPGLPVFRESYVATGNNLGPVAVFGARYAADRFTVGGEIRYQKAEGDLDTDDFFGPKIDLGGFHYSATFGVRF